MICFYLDALMLHITNDLAQLHSHLNTIRDAGASIALVPTMGNLHKGHIALVDEAKRVADYVVVSIFVNPEQFGDNEDLLLYPKTMDNDKALLEGTIDVLFTPDTTTIYPQNNTTFVDIPHLTNDLCGAFRPIHFRGVLTVVNLLFNLIRPDYACFGKKDFQQMRLIEYMVRDFHMLVSIIEVNTGREESGLACSSRNQYLSQEERHTARLLFHTLLTMKVEIIAGNTDFDVLCTRGTTSLTSFGFSVEYLKVRDHSNLQKPKVNQSLVILAAARLGTTRLIDNIEVIAS